MGKVEIIVKSLDKVWSILSILSTLILLLIVKSLDKVWSILSILSTLILLFIEQY